jgi:hypothetical protein
MPYSAVAAPGLGLDMDYLKCRESISSWSKLLAITLTSNVKLNNVEVLKLSDGYEL